MKLFHCSDLHLGKRMFERSLLEDQRYLIDQICRGRTRHLLDYGERSPTIAMVSPPMKFILFFDAV